MKKLIAMAAAAVCLISSTFALNISVGGRAMLGVNLGADYSGFEGIVGGGGAFFNLELLGGFGFQGEANIVTNQIEISPQDRTLTTTDYSIVDLPFMFWYNLKLGNLVVGGGAGLNFSSFSNDDVNNQMNVGVAAGANLKYLFSDHFGLVFGAHSVFDFLPTVTVTSSGKKTTYTANGPEYTRKSIYGTVGLEYRF